MKLLEERIIKDGIVKGKDILKVDSFLNHQIDVHLLGEMGKEFKRIFDGCGINKILTIESSGIGIACMTAQVFDVPVVFAKRAKALILMRFIHQRLSRLHTARFMMLWLIKSI